MVAVNCLSSSRFSPDPDVEQILPFLSPLRLINLTIMAPSRPYETDISTAVANLFDVVLTGHERK